MAATFKLAYAAFGRFHTCPTEPSIDLRSLSVWGAFLEGLQNSYQQLGSRCIPLWSSLSHTKLLVERMAGCFLLIEGLKHYKRYHHPRALENTLDQVCIYLD